MKDGYYALALDEARRIVNEAMRAVDAERPLSESLQRKLAYIANSLLHRAEETAQPIGVAYPKSWSNRP
jgi:hypothetical protein